MNNMACLVLTALPRAQAFSRRWEGKTLAFFPFLLRFLLFLALLVNTA